jgi:MarR family 2-MHQ and catechol resistance regulon transcriptional repressor
MASSPKKRPTDIPAPRLSIILSRAAKTVDQIAHESIQATGLCLSDFAVLEILLHKGPLPVNTIGSTLLLTSGSISTAIDRLQKRKLVRRLPDESDRRVTHVHLTPSGRRLIEKAYAGHSSNLERSLSSLSQPEKNRLALLLKKVGLSARENFETPS